jgi:hypothetical protein
MAHDEGWTSAPLGSSSGARETEWEESSDLLEDRITRQQDAVDL